MITQLINLLITAVIAVVAFKLILSVSKTAVKILLHIIAGWVLLTLVNILPGIHIPLNLLTIAISGFGGVFGTLVLVIFYLIF